jgi:hypothetical protein
MTSRQDTGLRPLLVPSALYGRTADVRRAAGRFVTAVRKGRSLREALNGYMVPVDAEHPGLIVLDRKWSIVGTDDPHFHLDLPWRRLSDAALKLDDDASFEHASRQALAEPWSFIGLLGGQLYAAVRTAAAQLRTLEAAHAHWPVLAAVGARYTRGSNVGRPLEEMHTLITFCLARQGAPMHDLQDLTPVRLHKHIVYLPGVRVRALLQTGDVSSAVAALAGHDGITLLSLAEHFLEFGLDDVACEAVARFSTSDPHGIVAEWLAGRGNRSRRVR